MKNTLDITGTTSLGELVTYFPAITEKLNELHIDYCCQGDRSLEATVKEAGLSDGFIGEVREAYAKYIATPEKEPPVTELTDSQLIDRILAIHHQKERNLWTELDRLVNKILRVHYEHDKDLLLDLHRNFSLLKLELEEHFVKEEAELFPLMEGEDKTPEELARISNLIKELEAEHEGAGVIIKRIIKLTNDFTPPDFACNSVLAVYAKLHELADDIFLHIAKENSVLFKRYQ